MVQVAAKLCRLFLFSKIVTSQVSVLSAKNMSDLL